MSWDMLTRAARALADRSAAACNVNADDNWNVYGEEFIADARAALDACGAADLLACLKLTAGRLQRVLSLEYGDDGECEETIAARAAIARAEGRS